MAHMSVQAGGVVLNLLRMQRLKQAQGVERP